MATKPRQRQEQKLVNAIEAVVCRTLDLMDLPLNPEQRHLAEQIYDLANSLQVTVDVQV